MPRSVTRRAPEEPRLSRMPHISAPVDEHPLVPVPPRPRLDRLLIGAACALAALGLLAYYFTHASALR